jgi:hypothetical protein
MNCRYDRFSLVTRQLPQELNDGISAEAIKARGWLIKKQDRWISD